MQTESRDASLLVIYAEVQLILCKDNANREQRCKLACDLCRGAAFLCKDNANREQRCKLACDLCRGAAYLMQR